MNIGGETMEIQNKLHEDKGAIKDISKEEKRKQIQDQVSTQDNKQDVDQEQNVNANPVQWNEQNVNITTEFDMNKCCGKITGVTYLAKNKKILSSVNILLYFGDISELPVYKTKSDENGNFSIEGLPPGYYSILAYVGMELRDIVQYIKVLVGQSVYQSIHLEHIGKVSEKEAKDINVGYTL